MWLVAVLAYVLIGFAFAGEWAEMAVFWPVLVPIEIVIRLATRKDRRA
jgi:hypothetical protein